MRAPLEGMRSRCRGLDLKSVVDIFIQRCRAAPALSRMSKPSSRKISTSSSPRSSSATGVGVWLLTGCTCATGSAATSTTSNVSTSAASRLLKLDQWQVLRRCASVTGASSASSTGPLRPRPAARNPRRPPAVPVLRQGPRFPRRQRLCRQLQHGPLFGFGQQADHLPNAQLGLGLRLGLGLGLRLGLGSATSSTGSMLSS